MKRLLLASIVLSAVAAASPATAGRLRMDKAPNMTTLSVGYGFADSKITKDYIDAYGAIITFDRLEFGRSWSFGASVGYIAASDEETIDGVQYKTHYSTFPFYITWRAFFGNPQGLLNFSLGAGFGLGFNRFERSTPDDFSASYGTSIGATVPVGVLLALTDSLWLRGEYGLYWLHESFFENDIAQVVSVGIVFPK